MESANRRKVWSITDSLSTNRRNRRFVGSVDLSILGNVAAYVASNTWTREPRDSEDLAWRLSLASRIAAV